MYPTIFVKSRKWFLWEVERTEARGRLRESEKRLSQNIYERGVDDAGAAKNLATEITNYNVEEKELQGEQAITGEHVQNNLSVRKMLGQRGIKPEELPPSEDIKKLERRVKSQEKKLAAQAEKLPKSGEHE